MDVTVAYRGYRRIQASERGNVVSLQPNLTRDAVSFDGALKYPLRFREAVSALHNIVVSDLKFKKQDKTAYEEWKKNRKDQDNLIYRTILTREKEKALKEHPLPDGFEKLHKQAVKKYWDAHQRYRAALVLCNPKLLREYLIIMDPVITVADDTLLFECFSKDESSYGCLTLNRSEGFEGDIQARYGTTNIDYSWDLYNHFQQLRGYHQTRFQIDPSGFGVSTESQEGYREEKIDLPASWLRGFMQIQSAMSLPKKKISISTEALYSVLAFLKRNKDKTSPRAIRFELLPDQPPVIVLEPWEKKIISWGTKYHGPAIEPIRVWGRRRLFSLARILPLAESIDVYLLGTGLPSFWVVGMREMSMTLGLSGWTVNDWTAASALDMLAPPAEPGRELVEKIGGYLKQNRSAGFLEIDAQSGASAAETAASLRQLAHSGLIIYDLPNSVYRWRPIMPEAIGDLAAGPEHEEYATAKAMFSAGKIKDLTSQVVSTARTVYQAKADNCPCEILMDADGLIRRGTCVCGYYKKYRLKNGPCRHMQALRLLTMKNQMKSYQTIKEWFCSF